MTTERIYTPRSMIDDLLRNRHEPNKSTCIKIPYRGYVISIAMDSSHGVGDLWRSDIRVFSPKDKDITEDVFWSKGIDYPVPATGESLKYAFDVVDSYMMLPTLGEKP